MTDHEADPTAGGDHGASGASGGDGTTSRRQFMVGGAAIGLGAAAATVGAGRASAAQSRLIDKALGASASAASLSDIKHVVILMQENRSFDHYFGTLSGVRGFSDPDVLRQSVAGRSYPVFDQFGYQPGAGADASGYLSRSTWSATRPRRTARTPTTSPTTGPPSTTAGPRAR